MSSAMFGVMSLCCRCSSSSSSRPNTFQRLRATIGGDNDALASALLKAAEYRYPRPHPWQEFVFHNHLSVADGMKAAHRDAIAGRQADAAG